MGMTYSIDKLIKSHVSRDISIATVILYTRMTMTFLSPFTDSR